MEVIHKKPLMNRLSLLILKISVVMTFQIFTIQSSFSQNGLLIGDTVQDFTAKNSSGELFRLNKSLKTGSTVVIFYRGYWCPFCQKHLSSLQDSLQLILDKGASIVIITPDKPENIEKMKSKAGTTLNIVWDEDYKIMNQFKVNFDYSNLPRTYHSYKNDNSTTQLPIPATFIIDQNRTVIWRHFNPDYKLRSSVKNIIDQL